MNYDDPIPELKRRAAAALALAIAQYNADDIGAYLGTDRARISEIRRGKLERFSLETLIRYLSRMHQRVELTVADVRSAKLRSVPREAT